MRYSSLILELGLDLSAPADDGLGSPGMGFPTGRSQGEGGTERSRSYLELFHDADLVGL